MTRLSGTTLTLSSGATAAATSLNGGTVVFGAAATLATGATTKISATLSGFQKGDTLDLAAFTFTKSEGLTAAYDAGKNQTTVTVTAGKLSAAVVLFGQYTAAGFHLAGDGHGGTAVTYSGTANTVTDFAPGRG